MIGPQATSRRRSVSQTTYHDGSPSLPAGAFRVERKEPEGGADVNFEG
jgi:hypothetical protein